MAPNNKYAPYNANEYLNCVLKDFASNFAIQLFQYFRYYGPWMVEGVYETFLRAVLFHPEPDEFNELRVKQTLFSSGPDLVHWSL